MSKKNLSPEEKLFRRNKWFYSVPGAGRDMAYNLYNSFLLTYILFTRELTTQQFSAISVVMIVCCVWDAINDPIMGGIIENTRTKFGKFKPWILIGAVSNAVILTLLFTNRTSGWKFVGIFVVFYLLWDITFTMNDISYWSMLTSLTVKAHERDSITSLANLFAGLGTVLSTALIPVFTAGENTIGGSSIKAYGVIAFIIAILFAGGQLFVCLTVKEPHVANVPLEERIGIKKMISVITHNDQLIWASLIILMINLASGGILTMGANLVYLEFGYNGTYVMLVTACFAGASGILYVIYPILSKKLSRNRMALISLIMNIAGYGAFLITGFVAPKNIRIIAYCIELFIIGLGHSLFYMLSTICLMNTIEYNEYKTGERNESIIFAVRPFMTKMASALFKLITMITYLGIGILAITNGISDLENQANMQQITEEAKISGINQILASADPSMAGILRCVMCLLPIILITASYIILRKKSTIDEKEYDRMVKEIEERKQATK